MNRQFLRIVDANLNRSREGLRVCEEIARFVLEDAHLTGELKNIRHRITRSIKKIPGAGDALLESRESRADVGKGISGKSLRKLPCEVFSANIQRVKESLRVLEELARVFNQSLSRQFSRMRFKVYELEKRIVARL